eukprot:SAG31_NODE_4569_length_3128_cov_53.221525_2_plen_106_part_00
MVQLNNEYGCIGFSSILDSTVHRPSTRTGGVRRWPDLQTRGGGGAVMGTVHRGPPCVCLGILKNNSTRVLNLKNLGRALYRYLHIPGTARCTAVCVLRSIHFLKK